MTNFNIIENKISSVQKYLDILEKYKKYSKKEIQNDVDIKGAVERYLYLATQATIELAGAVVSFKNLRKPSTLRESFQILNEKDIIKIELMEKMTSMVGFRNTIAHDYEDLDYGIVYDVLQNKLKDIKEFQETIKNIF
ncbi:DUF86 domain-containing protein [Patescibacteria group bacterium]|nr:DUF86 domain-containing protein [Patescibacteria group bacterium]MBU2633369.1 DUF86 domain-containing protein [Patescibacteria group bacterium]